MVLMIIPVIFLLQPLKNEVQFLNIYLLQCVLIASKYYIELFYDECTLH